MEGVIHFTIQDGNQTLTSCGKALTTLFYLHQRAQEALRITILLRKLFQHLTFLPANYSSFPCPASMRQMTVSSKTWKDRAFIVFFCRVLVQPRPSTAQVMLWTARYSLDVLNDRVSSSISLLPIF